MSQSSAQRGKLPIHRRDETPEELVEGLIRQISDELKGVEEVFDSESARRRANQAGIPEDDFLDAMFAHTSIDDLLAVVNRCGYHVRVNLEPIPDA